MLLIAGVAILALTLSLVLTPLCRNASCRLGLFDKPDDRRKLHPDPVPRIGGIAIFLAVGGTAAVFGLLHEQVPVLNGKNVTILVPAMAIIFLTGLIDDIRGLKAWQKLACQLVAAGVV